MKQRLSLFVLLLLATLVPPSAFASYDFSAVAPTGQTLYYNVISSESNEVAVTYPYNDWTWGSAYNGYTKPIGNLLIPDSVEYDGVTYAVAIIGAFAFQYCAGLTAIVIPDGATSIDDSAFYGCSSLTSITLPGGLTSIGNGAFYGCSSITNITLPDEVTSIGKSAFHSCTSLTSITIPDGVTSIENNTFVECSSLTSITLPDGLTSIGNSAFSECSSLTSLTIPDEVTSIGWYAFYFCSSLTSINLPDGVTSISQGMFAHCGSLTSITLPDGVTSIGDYAFRDCSNLTDITIPNGVTIISQGMFLRCSSLSSITLPSWITNIGNEAFSGCSSLTSITLPNGVYVIKNSTFRDCSSLTSITIPYVTSIWWDAFYGCSSLTSITILKSNPPKLDSYAFSYDTEIQVYVPCQSVEKYENAEGWKDYQNFTYIEMEVDVVLNVSVNDSTIGTASAVMHDGHLITCADSMAIIQATPNYGYHFTHWSNGSTNNPDTLYLKGDSSLTALFDKNVYTIATASNDTAMGYATGSGTLEYLDTLTLTATCTAAHHHFVRWSDGVTDAVRVLTVERDSLLTALFAIDTHSVVFAANDESYGTVNGPTEAAYGSTIVLTAEAAEGYHFVQWSDGTMENPYALTLTSDTAVTALFTPDLYPTLCMVGVQGNRNVLQWERVEEPCSAYRLYREGSVAGQYELMAEVPADSATHYVDSLSRPMTRSYRYRISGVDPYGRESEQSTEHKTMHLTISQGVGNQWNLVWTEYEGAEYTTYVIYRGTSMNDLQQIDVMPSGGNTTYTDTEAPEGEVYYQVGVMMSNPCGGDEPETVHATKGASISRSNIATNGELGIGTVDESSVVVRVENGQVVVEAAEGQQVVLYDMTGRVLGKANEGTSAHSFGGTYRFDVPTSGTYLVKVGNRPARRVVVVR